MIAWVLIGIDPTFLLLLLDWLFPTGTFVLRWDSRPAIMLPQPVFILLQSCIRT